MSKKSDTWRIKTLDELDPPAWQKPSVDSYLLATCHRLRSKRVCDFSIEDLRIMIGQGIGLGYLLPFALEALERNPLARGDFYPGDLLAQVLRIDAKFWAEHPNYRKQMEALVQRTRLPAMLNEHVATFHGQGGVPSA
jgi:hypothetical protein